MPIKKSHLCVSVVMFWINPATKANLGDTNPFM